MAVKQANSQSLETVTVKSRVLTVQQLDAMLKIKH